MTPSRRVVLVDLDGPVLDVRQRYFAAYREACEGMPVRLADSASFWSAKRRRMANADLLQLPPGEPLLREYEQRWRRCIERDDLLELDCLQPRARESLHRLRLIPRRVLVTMRTNDPGVRATLRRLEVLECFTDVAVVPHAAGSKLQAFRQYGSTEAPQQTVVIGDSEVDVEPARSLGFHTLAVACGIRTPELLESAGAHTIVPDLAAAVEILLGEAVQQPAKSD